MPFLDIIRLALRNLRQAKLRAALTTMGIIIGIAVIVTMVSFGLGLQRNTIGQFTDLDSFHEIHVYGRSLFSLAAGPPGPKRAGERPAAGRDDTELRYGKTPERSLDDKALKELEKIPGVSFVKPHIFFVAFARSNNVSLRQPLSGAMVPEPTARFKELAAGRMIGAPDAAEVVVAPEFIRDFRYGRAADALGQTLELLEPVAAARRGGGGKDTDLGGGEGVGEVVVARTYRIVGVLKGESGGNRFNAMMPRANIYLPLQSARAWKDEHLDEQSKVALALARENGAVDEHNNFSYTTAVVRVADPVGLDAARRRIAELGFGSFSFMDEFEQARVWFLIINAALGLLGGISLLVASFGIANTMLMSILERTREIGIMKAIGAEDRQIKLIFFVEAAILGLTGGTIGAALAWGIERAANPLAYRFLLRPHGVAYVDFFELSPTLCLGALGLAVLVSIVAALYPASRAVRVDPVAALRHD